MGEALVRQMVPALEKMSWPAETVANEVGRTTYEVGLEKVNNFKGDAKALGDAVRTFQTGQSRPYAYAGVAYTLVAAAREANGGYSPAGLDAAMKWLEKAQELAPDVMEINVVEAYIYIYSGRLDDARVVLDYLQGERPDEFYLLEAEAAFWQAQDRYEETVASYEQAVRLAPTRPQRTRLESRLGDYYLRHDRPAEALEHYKVVATVDQSNPWLWHNMSLAYWQLETYEEAARCNRKALTIMDFPAGRQMEEAIKSRLDTGVLRRLFGR